MKVYNTEGLLICVFDDCKYTSDRLGDILEHFGDAHRESCGDQEFVDYMHQAMQSGSEKIELEKYIQHAEEHQRKQKILNDEEMQNDKMLDRYEKPLEESSNGNKENN